MSSSFLTIHRSSQCILVCFVMMSFTVSLKYLSYFKEKANPILKIADIKNKRIGWEVGSTEYFLFIQNMLWV